MSVSTRPPRKAREKGSKIRANGQSQEKPNIKWDKGLDKRLAVRLSSSWKAWEQGIKTQLCWDWAKDLGITLNPNGTQTKNHLLVIINQYRVAKDMEDATGLEDLVETIKVADGSTVSLLSVCLSLLLSVS